jgi:uncharacterized membrane protein
MSEPTATPLRRGTRWLLFGSLALNLFFIGIAVALTVRSPPPRWDRNVLVRIERIANTLPKEDADILRETVKAQHSVIETAQRKYRDAREHIRDTLRQQQFSEQDLRSAMTATRAARQGFDQVVQGAFAEAATKMSPEGRQALADWRNRRRPRNDRQ